MKKNVLLSLLMLFSISVMSQEKGLYLTISGGLGPTGYKYNIQGVNNFATPKNQLLLGGQAGLGVSYYFTKHFGISTGIGVSHYRSYAKLLGKFEDYNEDYLANINNRNFNLGVYWDNDFGDHPTQYNLRVRTQNWLEYQSGKFIEVPIILNLQKKFGKNEFFGIYLGLGAKFMIPIQSEYAIKDELNGTKAGLNIYGYYPEKNLYMGRYDQPPLDQHAFGMIYDASERLTNAKGKLDHKFNVALVGEGGFLFSLSRRVDLALGAFIDYGLLNLKRKTDDQNLFVGPESQYVQGAEDHVGQGIAYNSITATDFVKKVSTFSYGGKIGVRIKLGKLSKREDDNQPIYVPVKSDEDTVLNAISDKLQALDSMMKEVLDAVNKPVVVEAPKVVEKERPDNYYSEEDLNIVFEPIYFDLNKSFLKPESQEILNRKIEILKRFPDLKLLILGNTCDIGKDYYNFELGARRAEAAKKYLIDNGIDANRLETSTHSKYTPELPNTSEANRTHNRRDDFRPLFPKKSVRP
jgi:outer membrane protein OmpA-like peptidoglycan-associated protein